MKKRCLSLLLALVMCLSLLPATAFAGVIYIGGEVIDYGDSDFAINSKGVLVKYVGDGGDVTIPDNVTSIGNGSFTNCTSVTSVTIPSSVIQISEYAFKGCTGLTSVTIPSSVNYIGIEAFSGCTSLASVTIPSRVTIISDSAFYKCSGLTSVTIPSSVTSIGNRAFWDCSSLKSVTIPDSVTSIGIQAFSGCTGLTSVTIPSSVTSIGVSAFDECRGLTSVTIPGSVTSMGDSAFEDCTSLTSVTISEGVTKIGNYAFDGCTGLTSVTIPEGVTSIGNGAFLGCTGLTSVTIPGSVTSIDANLYGSGAFEDCTSLTSATFSEGITTIQINVFKNCTSLTSVTLPVSLTSIHAYAFNQCSKLAVVYYSGTKEQWKAVKIESYDTYIPKCIIHCSDGDIGEENDPNFTIEKGVLIKYKGSGGAVTIPDGVTKIGDSAFANCSGLTSVTIPNSVTSIGNQAFEYCSGLTSVTIPSGVKSIGYSAFSHCRKLTAATLPASVTSIGQGAFDNTALKDLYFGGTQAQWKAVKIAALPYERTGLMGAVIHCSDGDIDNTGDLYANGWMYLWTTNYRERIDSPLDVGLYDSPTVSVHFKENISFKAQSILRWTVEDEKVAQLQGTYHGTFEKPAPAGKTVDVTLSSSGLLASDPDVVICPRKAGTTKVTAEIYVLDDGKYVPLGEDALSFTLTVSEGSVPQMTVTPQNVSLEVGETKKFTVKLSEGQFSNPWELQFGNGAIEKLIEFTGYADSSDKRSCTVTIKGIAPGTADMDLYLGRGSNAAAITSTKQVVHVTVTGGQSTVSFDSQGGSAVPSKTVTVGEKYGELPTPTREGYTFDGWYTSTYSSGTKVTSSTTVTTTENHTLYARWIETDGKLTVSPSSVTFDKAKEGYDQPAAKTVTVTNDGDGEITLAQPAADDFELGRLSAAKLAPKASATFTVRPKAGLKAGVYSDTITVKSTDGKTSAAVSVSFTVEEEPPETEPAQSGFTDVPANAWYYDAVTWALEKGVTTGTSATTFSPNATCTRAQVVTLLWRLVGQGKMSTAANPFKDVPAGQYYAAPVLWAVENNITGGTSATTFSPNAACTRGQVVTFLWRAAGQPEPKTASSKFTDVQNSKAYYYKAVLWAVENGITTGTSATAFSPNATCTRGQIVTFLYRAYNK